MIPEDISVIGFTGSLLAKHILPSLTTVSQNAKKMGKLVNNALIDRIESKDDYSQKQQAIDIELIIRKSSK